MSPTKNESVAEGFMPLISAYSNPNVPVSGFAFNTAIIPFANISAWAVVGKNNLYCDLLLIIVEVILSVPISAILSCICLDTVPNSTSPILSVPAIVRSPSGAK